MKKYFLIAAAAVAALASCTKVTVDVPEVDQEISFTAVNHVSATKADDQQEDGHGHLEFYSAGTFAVNAYFSASDFSNVAASTLYMDGVGISY